jgi:hypothetical protein
MENSSKVDFSKHPISGMEVFTRSKISSNDMNMYPNTAVSEIQRASKITSMLNNTQIMSKFEIDTQKQAYMDSLKVITLFIKI